MCQNSPTFAMGTATPNQIFRIGCPPDFGGIELGRIAIRPSSNENNGARLLPDEAGRVVPKSFGGPDKQALRFFRCHAYKFDNHRSVRLACQQYLGRTSRHPICFNAQNIHQIHPAVCTIPHIIGGSVLNLPKSTNPLQSIQPITFTTGLGKSSSIFRSRF